jgi:hypothetical protein
MSRQQCRCCSFLLDSDWNSLLSSRMDDILQRQRGRLMSLMMVNDDEAVLLPGYGKSNYDSFSVW